MHCPACKADASPGSVYCPKCGHRLDEPAPGAAPAAPFSAPPAAGHAPSPFQPRGGPKEPERELWKGHYSPKAMIGWWLVEGLIVIVAIAASILLPNPITWIAGAVVVLGMGLWLLMAILIKRFSLEYVLTTEQLIHRAGLLTRTTNRVETIDIDDVTFEQTLIERMVGVGSILIISSDKSHPRLFLHGIDEVQRVADLIDNTSREQRRLRGAFIEQV